MAIDVKNVYKSFKTKKDGELYVLKDINLHIDDGELICILGPSGCGKTTLIRIIAGLEDATQGEVYDHSGLVEGPSVDRGFIFQQYSLFPWLTVLDNVMFGLELNGGSKKENMEKAERYLDKVGLREFKDSYPHELSGGMKQRVAIIRSLINHTPILIMDEPFSAIDMQNRHRLQDQLIQINERVGSTVLFITHDVDESVYLADRIVVMDRNPGCVKEIIDVNIAHPRDRGSKEFLELQSKVEALLGVFDG